MRYALLLSLTKIAAAFLLLALSLHAQAKCDSFYAAAVSLNQTSSANKLAFDGAVAVPLTNCASRFQPYSFTQYTVQPIGNLKTLTFQTVMSTGFAYPLKSWNGLDLFAVGNFASAVAGKSASLTSVYGGLLGFPVCKCKIFGQTPRGLFAAESVAGNKLFSLGGGMTFGGVKQ